MNYVTPDDMKDIFEEPDLVEISNHRDANAQQIDEQRLQSACDGANGIIKGYFPYAEPPDAILPTLRIHGANLAYNLLDGSLESVRLKANDAIAWLKLFSSSNLGSAPVVATPASVSTIAFDVCQPRSYSNVRELF